VTLGDADFRKSLMKMIYRKLPKTASLPVTCHPRTKTVQFCLHCLIAFDIKHYCDPKENCRTQEAVRSDTATTRRDDRRPSTYGRQVGDTQESTARRKLEGVTGITKEG
jgi:hypothetical protein